MSEEAMRGSGVWSPLTDGDDTEVIPLRFWCCVNIPEHPEGDKIMSFLHGADTCDIGCVVIFHNFLRCRSMWKNSSFRIVPRMSTGVAGGLRGVAMPQDLALGPLTRLEVRWRVQTPGTRLRSVTPFTDGAVAGAWRGETAASGRHGGDPVVGWARTLFRSVPMG